MTQSKLDEIKAQCRAAVTGEATELFRILVLTDVVPELISEIERLKRELEIQRRYRALVGLALDAIAAAPLNSILSTSQRG